MSPSGGCHSKACGIRIHIFPLLIELAGSKIYYRVEDQWINFQVNQIQLIGEFSAPPGLLAADYFFSIKLRDEPTPIDIPAYTDGFVSSFSGTQKAPSWSWKSNLADGNRIQKQCPLPSPCCWATRLFNFRSESSPVFDFPLVRNLARKQVVHKDLRTEVMALVN